MPRKHDRGIPTEWLRLALNQAAYIHRHEEIAKEIIKGALRRFNVRSAEQKKRLFAKTKYPARIYLRDLHLLQHLVFLVSEEYEKSQEVVAPASITELDLIVRYIAFIVRKSLRRNSLYGVTGICRFICRYELNNVRRIHEVLVDDPDKYKSDDDFRGNRKKMRNMILERFSRYLRIESTQKGTEKHFYLREDQSDKALWQLTATTLDSFKPWESNCLPADFNIKEVRQPVFADQDEHSCEITRLHALIHQDCFRVLTDVLKYDQPSSRLGIPQFFFNSSSAGGGFSSWGNSSAGSAGDDESGSAAAIADPVEELRRMSLYEEKRLVRFVPKGMLSIKLDGKEVARLNPAETSEARFSINDESAEIIEIVSESEQLILATHLLDDEIWQSPQGECSYVVRHHHGPRIVFNLQRLGNASAIDKRLSVMVTYKKAQLAQFGFFLKQRLASWLAALKLGMEHGTQRPFPSGLQAPVVSTNYIPLLALVSLVTIVALVPVILSLRSSTQYVPGPATTNEPVASSGPANKNTDDLAPSHILRETNPTGRGTNVHRVSRHPNKSKRAPNHEPMSNSVPNSPLAAWDQVNNPLSVSSSLLLSLEFPGEVKRSYESYSCIP